MKKISKIISVLCVLLLSLSALTADTLPKPMVGEFTYGVKFSVSGYEGTETLENFPVLVKLENDVPSRFSYFDVASNDNGSDICFIDMQGKGIPFDIEVWDPMGTSYIWVSLPEMTNGTEFVMCYGSTTKGKDICPENPWSSYKGVWYMENTSPVDEANDYDGTGTSQLSVTNGVIGNSVWYPNVSGEAISCGSTMQNSDLANGFVVEGWINPAVYGGAGDGRAIFGKYQFISFRIASQNQITVTTPRIEDHKANISLPATNEWYHIALSFQPTVSGGMKLYINGELKSTMNASKVQNLDQFGEMWLGRNEWNDQRFYGAIDEMRLSDQIRSDDWIAASYSTVSKDDFLTSGIAQNYDQKAEPNAGIIVTEVGYTNASISVLVGNLGTSPDFSQDASWVDSELIISEKEDFSTYFLKTQLERFDAPTTRIIPVSGLTTNTTYFVKLVSKNNFDLGAESHIISFQTLTPGAPTGIVDFLSSSIDSITISGKVIDFGVGAKAVKIFAEASTSEDFSNAISSEKMSAEIDSVEFLVVEGLALNTSYYLRLGIENDWGVVTYVPYDTTQATLEAPAQISEISFLANRIDPNEFGYRIEWDIINVEDGAVVDVELFIDGESIESWENCGGTMGYVYYGAKGSTHFVKVVATVALDGNEYKTEKIREVTLGKNNFVVGYINSYVPVVTKVGDTITLPRLKTTKGYYELQDIRPFVLEDDGVTMTAIETGFTTVVEYDIDVTTGGLTRKAEMQLAICAPTPKGEGNVFVAESRKADITWSDLTLWTNITDPTAEPSYPNGKDDVVIIPIYNDKKCFIDTDVTVGALYVGWTAEDLLRGTIRIEGKNGATLTFDTSDGSQALLRVTGLARWDVVLKESFFYLGNEKADKPNLLSVEMPNGLIYDCGKHPDYTDTVLRDTFNNIRIGNGYTTPIEVPEGKVFHIINTDHGNPGRHSQNTQHSNFRWNNGSQVYGKGTIIYDGSAGYFNGALTDFAGTLIVRNKQKYDSVGIGERDGGYWLYNAGTWGPTNSTLVIEGHVEYNGVNSSVGVVTYGSAHAWGAWGPGSNSLHQAGMVLHGGTYYQRPQANGDWAVAGITKIPNWAEKLVVSNGYSCVKMFSTGVPTNRVEFMSLEQANRGTFIVDSTDTQATTEPAEGANANHIIIHGMEKHAIGGGGEPGSETESIIPWMICTKQWPDRAYFPYRGDRADETNVVCFKNAHPTRQVLDVVQDSNANVFVEGASIALTRDLTVNSLCINRNYNNVTALGEGRTLTITSGGLILEGETSAIGKEADYLANTAGTIFFPNPAYIYSTIQSTSAPNQIWASIVAPKGAAISFPGDFVLGGNQTGIDEELAINGTRVTIGSATTDCLLDVPVRLEGGTTKLTLRNLNTLLQQSLYLNDHATIGPKVNVASSEKVTKVNKLFINGESVPRGTYGSSSSSAEFVDDEHFVGDGIVQVLSDEVLRPTTIIIR